MQIDCIAHLQNHGRKLLLQEQRQTPRGFTEKTASNGAPDDLPQNSRATEKNSMGKIVMRIKNNNVGEM